MKQGTRAVVYDGELRIEAYRFEGVMQPFPNHFHEHYVIGLMEGGERALSCRGREYAVKPGDLLLFNPGDSHACVQSGGALDYRGLNIPKDVMLDLAEKLTGRRELPGFSQNVLSDQEAARSLRVLHVLVMERSRGPEKEGGLSFLLARLLRLRGQPFERCVPECRAEIETACAFLKEHYARHVCLDEICRRAGLSKSTLLRAFVRSKGVTPYSYLENIRISEAKKLLERGVPPVEAALSTGFSDQSHFTNSFHRFLGLTPGACREIFLK